MCTRRYKWLIRLMALVMVLAAPLHALASSMHDALGAHARMNVHMTTHAATPHAAPGQHCTHTENGVAKHGQSVDGAQQAQDHGDPTCMGSCGACAHCPAGIGDFAAFPEAPTQDFVLSALQHPSSVAPDAALRPPRTFS